MKNCARISFKGCSEFQFNETYFVKNTTLKDKFADKDFPVSMFFNNSVDDVMQQLNYCG